MHLLNGTGFDRVLAVGAHPDDVELGAGGLLSRLSRAGKQVVIAILSAPTNTKQRIAEAREGARLVGAELVMLQGKEATRVEDVPMYKLVARLDEVVAQVRPEVVLAHAKYDRHNDHRLAHEATLAAVRRIPCNLLSFPSSPEFNIAWNNVGECFADISETIDVKIAALRAHASQVAKGTLDVDSCRDLARALGRMSGVGYAEAYQIIRLRL